ncbi:DUF1643 domain-containing protein [Tissierella pigra]|uniref:DUF1643 domain-containing protein n=1 Tax=Tissierella pigra TaxID=2607614 RepID=UPI001C0F3F46|nr:DUF1643 domain-containing protein [uncultured Clostridium sp.]MBU5425719.1 DUF1643 domain-containing protein [Tissierella pigra]
MKTIKDIVEVKNMIETDQKQINTEVKFLKDGQHTYRYLLKKQWSEGKNTAAVIMLNPSKANSLKMDQTVMNVMNYLVDNGFSGMSIVNLFSYMSTNPDNLKYRNQDYESVNIEYIEQAFEDSSIIIIAWTRGGQINEKRRIKGILKKYEHKLKCFKDGNDKIMRHPSRGFNDKWTLVDYNFNIEGL